MRSCKQLLLLEDEDEEEKLELLPLLLLSFALAVGLVRFCAANGDKRAPRISDEGVAARVAKRRIASCAFGGGDAKLPPPSTPPLLPAKL